MYEHFGNSLLIIFTIKKIIFTIKKLILAGTGPVPDRNWLQQYCCNSTVPTVLLRQYCCNNTACTVLYVQYCFFYHKKYSSHEATFFNEIKCFFSKIDQQAEIFHSSLSKQYCNITSISIIKLLFKKYNNMIFS